MSELIELIDDSNVTYSQWLNFLSSATFVLTHIWNKEYSKWPMLCRCILTMA